MVHTGVILLEDLDELPWAMALMCVLSWTDCERNLAGLPGRSPSWAVVFSELNAPTGLLPVLGFEPDDKWVQPISLDSCGGPQRQVSLWIPAVDDIDVGEWQGLPSRFVRVS